MKILHTSDWHLGLEFFGVDPTADQQHMIGEIVRIAREQQADAVIVLGAAVHGDRVTWVLSNRLDAAIAYLEAHPDAIAVVSGGQGAGETVTEGSAMRKYLLEHGIAEDRVIAEERATNTTENFLFSKALIDEALMNDMMKKDGM